MFGLPMIVLRRPAPHGSPASPPATPVARGDLHGEIATLRSLVEERDEEIRQLRLALVPQVYFPRAWRLTSTESRLLAFLLARSPQPRTKEQIVDAIYAGSDEAPDPKIVDVFVCKLRDKIKPFGLEILTHRGSGYSLDPAGAEAVRMAVAAVADGAEIDGLAVLRARSADSGADIEIAGRIVSREHLEECIAALRAAADEARWS